MENILINYSSNGFEIFQEKQCGYFNKLHPEVVIKKFDPSIIESTFKYIPNDVDKQKIYEVLSFKKGGGLWAWKILIINMVLQTSTENDRILYMDSGILPLINIIELYKTIQINGNYFCQIDAVDDINETRNWLINNHKYSNKLYLIMEESLFLNYKWDKRLINEDFFFTKKQICGGIQGWLNNEENKNHLANLLRTINIDNYSDEFNISNNYYIAHRHDQSIISEYVHKNNLHIDETLNSFIRINKLHSKIKS